MRTICYTSHADKRDIFARVTVPAIFTAGRAGALHDNLLDAWLFENRVLDAPRGLPQLRALHEAARAGRYVPGPWGCDAVLPVYAVLQSGGDCDNWAAVIIASLLRLGYGRIRLASFGDARDPHQHVAVVVFEGGAWRYLDAKGDQRGGEFLARPRGFEIETFYAA